jgi:hypothetical protein
MCFCHHARNSEKVEPLFALRHFIEVINIPRSHAPALECIRALPHTFGANQIHSLDLAHRLYFALTASSQYKKRILKAPQFR